VARKQTGLQAQQPQQAFLGRFLPRGCIQLHTKLWRGHRQLITPGQLSMKVAVLARAIPLASGAGLANGFALGNL